MSKINVNFKTAYEDLNYKSYSFDKETTIESMLLTFLKIQIQKLLWTRIKLNFFTTINFLIKK